MSCLPCKQLSTVPTWASTHSLKQFNLVSAEQHSMHIRTKHSGIHKSIPLLCLLKGLIWSTLRHRLSGNSCFYLKASVEEEVELLPRSFLQCSLVARELNPDVGNQAQYLTLSESFHICP